MGCVLTLFSIIEFCLGSVINNFFKVPPVLSDWWSTTFFIAAGSSAMSSNNKGLVIIACIASSIGVLAGLSNSLTESDAAATFDKILSCGTYKTPPSTVGFTPTFSNMNIVGNSISKNTTSFCLYRLYLSNLDSSSSLRYDSSSCYCGATVQPRPANAPDYADSCLTLTFSSGGAQCTKVFTSYTPTLKASAGIVILLTILSFILAVLTCFSLCCEVRDEELPVIPAHVATPGATIQMSGPTHPSGGLRFGLAGGQQQQQDVYADGGKVQQAYYIDDHGNAIGMPTQAQSAFPTGNGSPTVVAVAYALPPPERRNGV